MKGHPPRLLFPLLPLPLPGNVIFVSKSKHLRSCIKHCLKGTTYCGIMDDTPVNMICTKTYCVCDGAYWRM